MYLRTTLRRYRNDTTSNVKKVVCLVYVIASVSISSALHEVSKYHTKPMNQSFNCSLKYAIHSLLYLKLIFVLYQLFAANYKHR